MNIENAVDLSETGSAAFLHLDDTAHRLVRTSERLELYPSDSKLKPIFVDFTVGKMAWRFRSGYVQGERIAKAIGIKSGKRPNVVDATAGLGQDGFVIAALGCKVQMVERSPIIAALLQDGLDRAAQDGRIGEWVQQRLSLRQEDSIQFLQQLIGSTECPDVVYLDPMYPHRTQSALPNKEMRIFRELVGDDLDAAELFVAAQAAAKKRVVVKRPRKAEKIIETVAPNFQVIGKSTRYDVYLTA